MFQGYRIVALVPAGRRAMMRAGLGYLQNCDLVDEVRVLVNTTDRADLDYINALQGVTHQRLPDGVPPQGARTVNFMYPEATDPQTVYVKFDDDIVWVAPEAIERLLAARIAHAQAFLVSPMVINNTHCTHHLQQHHKLELLTRYVGARAAGFAWSEGAVGEALHHELLSHISADTCDTLHTPDFYIAHSRFSINCIAFFGRDMAKLGGEIPAIHRFKPDDEEFLSVHAPRILGTYNVVIGTALVAHFSFAPQAEHMLATGLLAAYQQIADERAQQGP